MTCYVINRKRAQNLNIARELRTKQSRRNVTKHDIEEECLSECTVHGYVYSHQRTSSLSSHQRSVALR